jgi:peptide-methionine (S)-S-oxide reductase
MFRTVVFLAGSLLAAAEFPDPATDLKPAVGKQTMVLAGGCFWCTEAVFEIIDGVEDVVSGYSGGTKETAKYDIVSTGRTGHAEAILITYDPAKTSYGQLLKIFFSVAHDPTSLNRQGADVGPSIAAPSSTPMTSRSASLRLISNS